MANNKTIMAILAAMLLSPLNILAEQDAGDRIDRRGVIGDDYYAAGGNIDVDAEVNGDVVAAGGTLSVGRRINGDVIMAGGTLKLHGQVSDDVRMAGGDITVDAAVGDDLIVAGGRIDISDATRIGGSLYAGGGDVAIDGNVRGDLNVGGGRVYINGVIGGDVQIEGEDIEIAKGARIDGDLAYTSSRKAVISPDAVIKGKVTFTRSDRYRPHPAARFISVITLSVAGIVLLLLFPNFTTGASTRMASDFWKHLGLGFAMLVATPIAAILMMATFVGIWIGLPLMAVYLISLLLAYLVAAFFVADRIAGWAKFDVSTNGRRITALVAALLLLTLLRFVPVLGGLLIFLLMLTALGSNTLQLYGLYRGETVKPKMAKRAKTGRKKK